MHKTIKSRPSSKPSERFQCQFLNCPHKSERVFTNSPMWFIASTTPCSSCYGNSDQKKLSFKVKCLLRKYHQPELSDFSRMVSEVLKRKKPGTNNGRKMKKAKLVKTEVKFPLLSLPNEVLLHIVSFLNKKDIVSIT
jgi:hypothetical protein